MVEEVEAEAVVVLLHLFLRLFLRLYHQLVEADSVEGSVGLA